MSLLDRLRTTIGDSYAIERELGGGGMSRVFLAEDVRLRRKVVVKVLSPELGSGMDLERFRREILLAAQLQHPHVVPVLAAGDADGLPYFTMPFVREGAIRAYRHYLALRSEPEPAVASQVAAVRAELRRLESESVGR